MDMDIENCFKDKFVIFLFVIVIILYLFTILIAPQLGPRDEFIMLPTLQNGIHLPFMFQENFPYVDLLSMGRFCPLAFQEFNLVAIFTNKPLGYFFQLGIIFIVFCVLYNILYKNLVDNVNIRMLSLLIIFFTPGFIITFFEIRIIERLMIIFVLSFLICYVKFNDNKRYIYFILAILFANLSLYYKETGCILIGAFALSHVLITFKEKNKKVLLLDVILFLSTVIYLCLYVIFTWGEKNYQLYTYTTENTLFVLVRNIANYAFFSDTITLLLICPTAIWRLYLLVSKKDNPHSILDPLIFTAAFYVFGYLVLNIYQPYYLLPAIILGFIPLLYFYTQKQCISHIGKIVILISSIVFVLNVLPYALHVLTYDKYLPVNFNKTIDFLVDDIKRVDNDKRVNIFLDGVDRDGGRGTYFIFGEYLKFKGLSIKDFDLLSTDIREPQLLLHTKQSPFDKNSDVDSVNKKYGYQNVLFPYTVMQPKSKSKIHKGDYLVVTPSSANNVNSKYIEDLKKEYALVFYTDSFFAVPSINGKTLMKLILYKFVYKDNAAIIMNSRNMMNWPDYYVFIKK